MTFVSDLSSFVWYPRGALPAPSMSMAATLRRVPRLIMAGGRPLSSRQFTFDVRLGVDARKADQDFFSNPCSAAQKELASQGRRCRGMNDLVARCLNSGAAKPGVAVLVEHGPQSS